MHSNLFHIHIIIFTQIAHTHIIIYINKSSATAIKKPQMHDSTQSPGPISNSASTLILTLTAPAPTDRRKITKHQQFSPWQTKDNQYQQDRNGLDQFCNQALSSLNSNKIVVRNQCLERLKQTRMMNSIYRNTIDENAQQNKQSLNPKRRPLTYLQHPKQKYQTLQPSSQPPPQGKKLFTRTPFKSNKQTLNSQKKLMTPDPRQRVVISVLPLEEGDVARFITESGSGYYPSCTHSNGQNFKAGDNCNLNKSNKEFLLRKRESSYIIKQKFIEIRRSMNLQLGIWGHLNKFKQELRRHKVINSSISSSKDKDKQNKFIIKMRKI